MEQIITFLNTYYLVIARYLFVIYAAIIWVQLKRCIASEPPGVPPGDG